MRIAGIAPNIFNSSQNIKKTAKQNSPIINNSAQDVFVSSKKDNSVSFKGFLFKKEDPNRELTPVEKKSREINAKVNSIQLIYDYVKDNAKEEAKEVDKLLGCGLITCNKTYKAPGGKTYKMGGNFTDFTLITPKYTTIETETHIHKGVPVKCIERRRDYKELTEATYDFTKEGYRYTEKTKDLRGKKIRTDRKVNMVKRNGIGKSTYMERNEDGTFTTYVYRGPKNKLSTRWDVYSPDKDGIWEQCGKSTTNLAERPLGVIRAS